MSETTKMTSTMVANEVEETGKEKTLGQLVGSLAFLIDKTLGPGDVAELRRLKPEDPASPAFFKLIVAAIDSDEQLPATGPARDAAEKRWAAVCQVAANTAGLHRPGAKLGGALQQAGLSELRLVRLLRAEGETLFVEVRRLGQFLASKAQPFDLVELARLVLVQDGELADSLRRGIARNYFRQTKKPTE
jgi:CRISPR system Cascade subunit CasB